SYVSPLCCTFVRFVYVYTRFLGSFFFFSFTRSPPRFTLFPYTTLFRSEVESWNLQWALPHLQTIHLPYFQCRSCQVHLSNYILGDRKSTRLNSSHVSISYAVFCLKKKNHNSILIAICYLLYTGRIGKLS